jgi:hypothetical protein
MAPLRNPVREIYAGQATLKSKDFVLGTKHNGNIIFFHIYEPKVPTIGYL